MGHPQGRGCIYCGVTENLTWDHIIPLNDGEPDTISNQVPACQSCNSSKGTRDAIVWYQEQSVEIPSIVWGKYLKLMHETYERDGMLDETLPDDERDKWSGLEVDRSQER